MHSGAALTLCLALQAAVLVASSSNTTPQQQQQLHCNAHQKDDIFAEIAPRDCYDAWKRGVSFAEEVVWYYDALCQPDCLAALSELDRRCGVTKASRNHLWYECAKNEKDIGCYELAARNSDVMYNVYAKCWNEIGTCTSECRAALEDFRDTHGCCVKSLYNATSLAFHDSSVLRTAVYYSADMDVVQYGLWTRCGIETPGFCRAPKGLSSSGSVVAAAGLAVVGIVVIAMFTVAM